MPTPVSSARQCLAAEAASALDDAVAIARRRQHAQTTSLHVVLALLSSSSSSTINSNSNSNSNSTSPLLRDVLSRARSSPYSPRLRFKALELCFGVALDRLPSSSISSSSSCSSSADEPPVSNSLMAAIKRSQANQRRHPDTFHFYQQQQLNNSSSSGVKVELQQVILAILDDPVVSRVFSEAGFRSSDIKLAVLRPPPPILRFPRTARCPPLFLCNFSAGDDFELVNATPRGFSFPFSAGWDENCRRIGEIMGRNSSRNPMLVGVGAGDAARDFAAALQRRSCGGLPLPPQISNLKFVSLERDVAVITSSSWIKTRLEELGRMATDEAGVAVGIGDLKGLVDLGEEVVDCLVSEMTRVLEECRGRLWVMGWSATYETYMKFLSRYPTLDNDWDLQLQLITSAARPAAAGLVSRQPSLMESFVPFGGFFPTTYESNFPLMKPYSSSPRCQLCNDEYEQELATILKGCSPSCEDQRQAKLPSWLQSVDMVRTNNPLDASKIKYDDKVLDARVIDLQKKWNDQCQWLHQGFPKPEAYKHQVLPPIIGLPFVSAKDRSINVSITSPGVTQSLSGLSSAFPVTVGLQTMTAASHSISMPVVSEPINKDLISKLQVGLSRGEQVLKEGLRSHQSSLSDLSTHEDHGSPASVTSVTTDLVLGTLREPSCNELAQLSPSKKANEVREHHFLSAPKDCLSSSNVSLKLDPSNLKAFYSSFVEKVRRQDAAIRAVSLAIVRCREHERRRGASLKGDIWLSFLGSDRFGKKRAATALAELIFGSRENMTCIDLGCQDSITSRNFICDQREIGNFDVNFRGKTLADQIAEEIRRKPSSVVFLENVEKADSLVQESLSQAIHTGKICDSYGRGCGINNAIFVVTASRAVDKTSSPRKNNVSFCEEKILAAQRWKMKMSVELISEATGRHPKFNVSITSTPESENKHVTSKRKLDASDCHKDQQQFSDSPKRAHKLFNTFLDLNLPVEEEVAENDADCGGGGNSSGGEEQWVEEFLKSMDENVSFEPFDFNALADQLMKDISKRFCSAVGSDCLMEIDTRAMEQILAASWLLEDARELNNWFDSVLGRSFVELRQRYSNKLSAHCVVRLVACEEGTYGEEHAPGVILPSRIILD